MKTSVDFLIKGFNQRATIQERGRLLSATAGNSGGQDTYIYMQHRHIRNLNPLTDFDRALKLCSDSGIVKGDILKCNDLYLLVMLIEPRLNGSGQLSHYLSSAYVCSSVVDVLGYEDSTKKHSKVLASGVRCLITQMTVNTEEDMTIAVKTYTGRVNLFEVFAQMDSDITKDCTLVDALGRRFRVSKESDPFIDENILRTRVQWEI